MVRVVAGIFLLAGVAVAADGPTYRPSPQSVAPAPVIRSLPAGCTPYNHMLAMARIGREGVGTPAFTNDVTTLSARYLGAEVCRAGAGSKPGEHWVSCATAGADQDAVTNLLARQAAAIAACFPTWKQSEGRAYWAGFTRPDGAASITLSLAHPSAGAKLDTTVRYASAGAAAPQAAPSCDMFFQGIRVMRAGREGPALPPYTDDITVMKNAYLGAPRCSAWLASGGATVNCPVHGSDVAWATRFFKERVATLSACMKNWRQQVGARHAVFTSLDGSVNFSVSMPDPAYGPMVDTSVNERGCDPIDEMMGRARSGRLSHDEPKPTARPTPIEMRYLSADSCSVRAVGASGGHAVSCVFPDATTRVYIDSLVKKVEACHPKWKRTDLSEAVLFEQGDGLSFLLEARNGRPAGIMMTFDPKAK